MGKKFGSAFFLVWFIFVALAGNSHGQSRSIQKLLPANSELSPWHMDGPPAIFKGKSLFEYINGGAEIYFEYGFKQTVSQAYINDDESLMADIYEMKNPQAAFGIYSIQRDYGNSGLGIGDDGTEFEDRVAFWKDRYLVSIMKNNPEKTENAALRQFAQRIASRITKSAAPPKVLAYLPQKGMIPRSRGYIKGLLGLNSQLYLAQDNILELGRGGVESVFAKYHHQKNRARLLVIRYQSASKSNKKKDLVEKVFSKHYQVLDENIDRFKDNKGRLYAVQSQGKFLFIIFKASSRIMIDYLTNEIDNYLGN